MATSANERQVAGSHYRAGYQHWDLVADNDMGYFEAQVTKYITRWRKKNGLQDLQKAEHYYDKLVELLQAKRVTPPANIFMNKFHDFCQANEVGQIEKLIVLRCLTYRTLEEFYAVGDQIRYLIRNESQRLEDDKTAQF